MLDAVNADVDRGITSTTDIPSTDGVTVIIGNLAVECQTVKVTAMRNGRYSVRFIGQPYGVRQWYYAEYLSKDETFTVIDGIIATTASAGEWYASRNK